MKLDVKCYDCGINLYATEWQENRFILNKLERVFCNKCYNKKINDIIKRSKDGGKKEHDGRCI